MELRAAAVVSAALWPQRPKILPSIESKVIAAVGASVFSSSVWCHVHRKPIPHETAIGPMGIRLTAWFTWRTTTSYSVGQLTWKQRPKSESICKNE